MSSGIIFSAIIVGDFTQFLVKKVMMKNKYQQKDTYYGEDHFVIIGTNNKLEGILHELRSKALNQITEIVIIHPEIDKIEVIDKKIKHRVFGIKGDILDFTVFARAGIERAKGILVLSNYSTKDNEFLYNDAEITLVFKAIREYLCFHGDQDRKKNKKINIVLEYNDNRFNLLPCTKDIEPNVEAYHELIKETNYELIIQPIYLEKMPSYLFTQSSLDKRIFEIIQRLISEEHFTNEFYYCQLPDDWDEKKNIKFNTIEKEFLKSNVTPIGILRTNKTEEDQDDYNTQIEKTSTTKLLINNNKDMTLQDNDTILVVSYTEKDSLVAKEKLTKIKQNTVETKSISDLRVKKSGFAFEKIIIINWNKHIIRDIISELAKLCQFKMDTEDFRKIEISLLNTEDKSYIKNYIEDLKKDKQIIKKLLKINHFQYESPINLEVLNNVGINEKNKDKIRVIILSENYDSQSDKKALYQTQLIENKVTREIVTLVELRDTKNYRMFKNTYADVTLSITDFSSKLLAQSLLKPYISLVYRNLLTFSLDTNEFYIRNIPKGWVGKQIIDFQQSLYEYPALFFGHIRKYSYDEFDNCIIDSDDDIIREGKEIITINPKYIIDYNFIDKIRNRIIKYNVKKHNYLGYGILKKRVLKTDIFKDDDQVILIARNDEIVENVLNDNQ